MEIDDRVWYRTKDYCKLGEDGLCHYVDRAANVIKYKRLTAYRRRGGIGTAESSAGYRCRVVGVPDPRVGSASKPLWC